jgi:hypothetical protein
MRVRLDESYTKVLEVVIAYRFHSACALVESRSPSAGKYMREEILWHGFMKSAIRTKL